MDELVQFFKAVIQDPATVLNTETLIAAGGLSILFLIIYC